MLEEKDRRVKESVAELTAVSEALEQAGLRAAEENQQLTQREREREIERFALLSELSHWQTLAAQSAVLKEDERRRLALQTAEGAAQSASEHERTHQEIRHMMAEEQERETQREEQARARQREEQERETQREEHETERQREEQDRERDRQEQDRERQREEQDVGVVPESEQTEGAEKPQAEPEQTEDQPAEPAVHRETDREADREEDRDTDREGPYRSAVFSLLDGSVREQHALEMAAKVLRGDTESDRERDRERDSGRVPLSPSMSSVTGRQRDRAGDTDHHSFGWSDATELWSISGGSPWHREAHRESRETGGGTLGFPPRRLDIGLSDQQRRVVEGDRGRQRYTERESDQSVLRDFPRSHLRLHSTPRHGQREGDTERHTERQRETERRREGPCASLPELLRRRKVLAVAFYCWRFTTGACAALAAMYHAQADRAPARQAQLLAAMRERQRDRDRETQRHRESS